MYGCYLHRHQIQSIYEALTVHIIIIISCRSKIQKFKNLYIQNAEYIKIKLYNKINQNILIIFQIMKNKHTFPCVSFDINKQVSYSTDAFDQTTHQLLHYTATKGID